MATPSPNDWEKLTSRYRQDAVSGEFVEFAVERGFRRHHWLQTCSTQQILAAAIHIVTLFVWWVGWRPPALMFTFSTAFALHFYGSFLIGNALRAAAGSSPASATSPRLNNLPLAQRILVLYVDYGISCVHWCITCTALVVLNTLDIIDACLNPAVVEAGGWSSSLNYARCSMYMLGYMPAVSPLQAILAAVVISLLTARRSISLIALLVVFACTLFELGVLFPMTNSKAAEQRELFRTLICYACIFVAMVTHASVSTAAKRDQFRSFQLLQDRSRLLRRSVAAERTATRKRAHAEKAILVADNLRQVQRLSVDFISHKLRNPLHTLENTVQAICWKHSGEDFQTLASSTADVVRLAQELVLHHELASGMSETSAEQVELLPWLQGIRNWWNLHSHQRGVIEIEPDVPATVVMDPRWAQQALQCLFQLFEVGREEMASTMTIKVSMIVAPRVKPEDVQAHKNVFTNVGWLRTCEELTRIVRDEQPGALANGFRPQGDGGSPVGDPLASHYTPPFDTGRIDAADTAISPTAAGNASDDCGFAWFLQVQLIAGGNSAGRLLSELAAPFDEEAANASVHGFPVFRTSTRMDIRLAKLAAGVMRGRIGLLDEKPHAVDNPTTRLVLQLPTPFPLKETPAMHEPWPPAQLLTIPPRTKRTVSTSSASTRPTVEPVPLPPAVSPSIVRRRGARRTTSRVRTGRHGSSSPSSEGGASPLHRHVLERTHRLASARTSPARSVSTHFFPDGNGNGNGGTPVEPGAVGPPVGDTPPTVSTVASAVSTLEKGSSDSGFVAPAVAATLGRAPEGAGQSRAPTHKPRVLVVDDERTIRKLHCRLLDRLDIESDAVEDGDEVVPAVEAAEKDGRPFDAILLDLVMKRQHGDTACQQLRASGYRGVIIAATANANSSDYDKLMAAGFTSVLCKPFAAAQLAATLQQAGLPVTSSFPDTSARGASTT